MRQYIVALGLLLVGLPASAAMPLKLPTEDEVTSLQTKYRAERDQVVRDGTAKRFLPILFERAEEMAKKGDKALAEGRFAQAREAYRQARWQLPYQTGPVPDHVARILGSLRLRHNRYIQSVAISPDGERLATAGTDGFVKLWDLGNGHELLSYSGHEEHGAIRQALFLPDGKRMVSAGAGKDIKVWDAATGKDLVTMSAAGVVSTIALSIDGKHLVAGTVSEQKADAKHIQAAATNTLQVFDVATGKSLRTIDDFREQIMSIAFNPAGALVAVGDKGGTVRLWQFPQMIENMNLPAYWSQQDNTGAAYAVAFSPDGETLVRCGQTDIKLYAVPAPGGLFQGPAKPERSIANPGSMPQLCALYSKDGKTLFTGGGDGLIRWWDADTGEKTGEFRGQNGMVWSIALHPEGNLLVSASSGDHGARLWDFDVVLQARDLQGHTGPVWMASFSPDGQRVVSAGADRSAKVWDAATGKIFLDLTGHNGPVTNAIYRPDGKVIATAGGDKLIRLWDATSGKLLYTCEGHQATVTSLDFSADGKHLASGGADRGIRFWDGATGKAELSFVAPAVVSAVAFSPDGKALAVGGIDYAITLYDLTGKQLQRWTAHGDAVTCVAYSPDGQYLASGGADGSVQVWLTSSPGVAAARLSGHAGPVSMVSFRKDNQHLVTGGSDQLVRLWKLEGNSGKEVQTYRGHKDWVTAASFSRDDYHIVSASVDRLVKVWEITSRELPLVPEHTSAVEALAVSPDNKLLATGASDNVIKLWDRATGAEVASLTGHSQPVISLAFTPDSKTLVSSGYEQTLKLWEVSPPRELPRSPGQMQTFSQLPRHSPYIFIEPEGKKLFVWLPPLSEPKNVIDCYDLQQGTKLFQLVDENRQVNSLAFCANGKLAASGAKDGSVRVYDLDKKGEVLPGGDRFLFDKIGVADLAITPDGKSLVVTSDKGEVKVTDVQSKQVRRTFQAHPGRIMACITSPDSRRCATLGLDNVLKLWDLESGRELRRWVMGRPAAESEGLAVRTLLFSADGRQLLTANANTTVYALELP
jgi:WD40 repeat protein